MSVQPTPTAATSMLTVTIQMDRTTALVIQDIAAMEYRVQVNKPEKKNAFGSCWPAQAFATRGSSRGSNKFGSLSVI